MQSVRSLLRLPSVMVLCAACTTLTTPSDGGPPDSHDEAGPSAVCWDDVDDDGYAPSGAASREVGGGCPRRMTSLPPSSPETTDCNDGDPSVHPGATETCNDVDDDCDVGVDESLSRVCATACGEGVELCAEGEFGSCEAPPEVCNGVDDDCDGRSDEGIPSGCWVDADGDGYASDVTDGQCMPLGGCPVGTTSRRPVGADVDCMPENAETNPGEPEVCDGQDNDCDAMNDVDECGVGCSSDVFSDRLYVFCREGGRSYGEALATCRSIGAESGSGGMELIAVRSSAEQTFVQTMSLSLSMEGIRCTSRC